MDHIAKFLAERLTSVERNLLNAFLNGDVADKDLKKLRDLRLIETQPDMNEFSLSSLGEKVHNQVRMHPDAIGEIRSRLKP